MRRRPLRESKADLDLAVIKCLTRARLTQVELSEILAIGSSDLIRDHGCDFYMAEQVIYHAKREAQRIKAQSQFKNLVESRRLMKEDCHDDHDDHGGRNLDYGEMKSDAGEGNMMKSSLRNVAVDAYRLHQMVEDADDLPQWCHYKIAQAQGMVQSVRNYLEYQLERMGEDQVGEAEMFDAEEMEEDFGEESTETAMGSWDDDDEYEEDEYDFDDDDDDDYDGYDGADEFTLRM